MHKKIFLVTGGAGFIGSNLIRILLQDKRNYVINLDKLTYAAHSSSVEKLALNPNYVFVHGDICNKELVKDILVKYNPETVIHLAAESHVDRSINTPSEFIQTNIVGTFVLLEESYSYWNLLSKDKKDNWLFLHVSTDEVYGDLGKEDTPFNEFNRYVPSSPYSASKASSDHLVKAWSRTYGLPVIVTNCSNNYGPFQHSEKLIPLTINNCILGKEIPVYGDGKQVRDWIYVEDHAKALLAVIKKGKRGQSYNIGGNSEMTNLALIQLVCQVLNELKPNSEVEVNDYRELISFVKDRPGHDKRYAIDNSKIVKDTGWIPSCNFREGIVKTIQWYLDNIS